MTVHELYFWIAAHELQVLAAVLAVPLAVGGLALLLRVLGRKHASQQVANVGVAIGFAAVFVEVSALTYVVLVHGVNPLAEASVLLLLAPPSLLVAGFAIEHLLHPGKQENIRKKLRFGVMAFVATAVIGLIFSVLRIYMLVFTNMWGFLLFIAVLIGVFYVIVRRLI